MDLGTGGASSVMQPPFEGFKKIVNIAEIKANALDRYPILNFYFASISDVTVYNKVPIITLQH